VVVLVYDKEVMLDHMRLGLNSIRMYVSHLFARSYHIKALSHKYMLEEKITIKLLAR
jgi:hypothetical protein